MMTNLQNRTRAMKTQPQACTKGARLPDGQASASGGDEPLAQKYLTIHPPVRIMPTDSGTGVLGGIHIINS